MKMDGSPGSYCPPFNTCGGRTTGLVMCVGNAASGVAYGALTGSSPYMISGISCVRGVIWLN